MFSKELWKGIVPIYKAILVHPFIKGLTDGSLKKESFKFYVTQDALYLREFARALSIAAAKAPEDDWIIMFNEHSAGALRVERALHDSFFRDFGIVKKNLINIPLFYAKVPKETVMKSTFYSQGSGRMLIKHDYPIVFGSFCGSNAECSCKLSEI